MSLLTLLSDTYRQQRGTPATVGEHTASAAGCGEWRGEKYTCRHRCAVAAAAGVAEALTSPLEGVSTGVVWGECASSHSREVKVPGNSTSRRMLPEGAADAHALCCSCWMPSARLWSAASHVDCRAQAHIARAREQKVECGHTELGSWHQLVGPTSRTYHQRAKL